jgi:hypothetical protein
MNKFNTRVGYDTIADEEGTGGDAISHHEVSALPSRRSVVNRYAVITTLAVCLSASSAVIKQHTTSSSSSDSTEGELLMSIGDVVSNDVDLVVVQNLNNEYSPTPDDNIWASKLGDVDCFDDFGDYSTTTAVEAYVAEAFGLSDIAIPFGGTFFADRGEFPEIHFGDENYDYQAAYNAVASQMVDIATMLATYDYDVADVPTFDKAYILEWANYEDDDVVEPITCVESCVADNMAEVYSNCTEPVSVAFVYEPELIIDCIVTGGDCRSCMDDCIVGWTFTAVKSI